MGKVEGKVVIVTGAASGIGLATSRRLLEDGATVVGADLGDGPGHLGDRWTYVPTDVTDEAAVEALVAAAVASGRPARRRRERRRRGRRRARRTRSTRPSGTG